MNYLWVRKKWGDAERWFLVEAPPEGESLPDQLNDRVVASIVSFGDLCSWELTKTGETGGKATPDHTPSSFELFDGCCRALVRAGLYPNVLSVPWPDGLPLPERSLRIAREDAHSAFGPTAEQKKCPSPPKEEARCTCAVRLLSFRHLPGCPLGLSVGQSQSWDDVPNDTLLPDRYELRNGRPPPTCPSCKGWLYEFRLGRCLCEEALAEWLRVEEGEDGFVRAWINSTLVATSDAPVGPFEFVHFCAGFSDGSSEVFARGVHVSAYVRGKLVLKFSSPDPDGLGIPRYDRPPPPPPRVLDEDAERIYDDDYAAGADDSRETP